MSQRHLNVPATPKLKRVKAWERQAAERIRILEQELAVHGRAEEALRVAERNYQTLFQEMPDGIALLEMIHDEQGRAADYRFLAINPALERMAGVRGQDLVGRTALEVMPAGDQRWNRIYARIAQAGEPVSFELLSDAGDKIFLVTEF
jgi:PAS domain S-box-containing protein